MCFLGIECYTKDSEAVQVLLLYMSLVWVFSIIGGLDVSKSERKNNIILSNAHG